MNQTNDIDIYNALVTTERGSITEYDIEQAIEEYKSKLPNPEMLYTKAITFEGLIRYIYSHCISKIIPNNNNRYNYKALDNVFNNIYIPLCSIYGFQPNIILFTSLCGIDYRYVMRLDNGKRTTDRPTTPPRELQALVQKWHNICESGLYSNVANHSSIGSMFLLKSVYGYQEQQQTRIEVTIDAPQLDTKQIDRIISTNTPQLPGELPE